MEPHNNQNTSVSYFDFSKLTNENFWKEILQNSLQAFIYTIRKYWYLFILTSVAGLISAEILYSLQVDKYHLSMTLRYGSIKNGLSKLQSSTASGMIGVGLNKASLGAVESFGANFDGVPTPSGTINNFGFNLKDFLVVVRGKFVSRESFSDKIKGKEAKITNFSASGSSSLATLTAVGANKGEVLKKAKELSDYLENLFLKRKRVIIEKIDERLSFSKEEYKLVSDQIKHIHKLEKDFGRTSEIVARKNTLYTQELSLRASLSEILTFKGENYIKDFEILSMSISPLPRKYLSRGFISTISVMITLVGTSISIILLVFIRLKRITEVANQSKEKENNSDEVHVSDNSLNNKSFKKLEQKEGGADNSIKRNHKSHDANDITNEKINQKSLNEKASQTPSSKEVSKILTNKEFNQKSTTNSFYGGKKKKGNKNK